MWLLILGAPGAARSKTPVMGVRVDQPGEAQVPLADEPQFVTVIGQNEVGVGCL